MSLQDLSKSIIEAGAPVLGTAIGGPLGLIVGALVSQVAKAFGADSANPQDIITKIQSDPDAKTKLAVLESNNFLELKKLQNQDTQNARSNNSLSSENTARLIAIGYTAGFFLYIAVSTLFPQLHNDSVLRCLEDGEMIILGYYFGSSASSARKDEYIRSKNL